MKPKSAKRGRRKLLWRAEQYRRGELTFPELKQCLMSWLGHVSHADTWGWRRRVLRGIVLAKG